MRRRLRILDPGAIRAALPIDRNWLTCEVREGVPTTQTWGYYASRNGSRTLVVQCRPGQRIRINGTIDITVLGADNETARFGIDGMADLDGLSGG